MKLIDKDALVAELKKRFDYRVNGLKSINNGTFWDKDKSKDEFNAVLSRCAYNAVKNEVFELMCFLDTLEVKEVDIKKEVINFMSSDEYQLGEESGCIIVAKHFFELGLKAQKGE